MVYVAFSEFFFDSALESYFRAGALKLSLVGDKVSRDLFVGWGPVMGLLPYPDSPVQVPHDLDMVLRASYFGSIVLMVSVGGRWEPGQVGGHTKCTPTRQLARRAGPPAAATE